MKIPYAASNFSPPIGTGNLIVSWPELVWAAVTYGKSSSCYYLKHPSHSRAEKKHRTYLLYTCLKQSGNGVTRSGLYDEMDHTEKGAASYFLGMTLTKLVADRLLDTPLLWHVSTSSQAISYVPGKSRPDLIGCSKNLADWIVAEAKGRSGGFDASALSAAKSQSQKITTINGAIPKYRFGSESFFNPNLCIALEDPPAERDAIPIEFNLDQALAEYYSMASMLATSGREERVRGTEFLTTHDPDLGVTVGLPTRIVSNGHSEPAQRSPDISYPEDRPMSPLEYVGRDEYFIRLDDRWSDQEMAKEPHLRNG